MDSEKYTGQQYKLRAGTPMSVSSPGNYVLHTFMVEVNDIDFIVCTDSLPASSEFRGQGGDFISANFSRLGVKGGDVFNGKIVRSPTYRDESTLE